MATLFRKPAHITGSGTDEPQRTYHYGVSGTISESTVRSLVAADLGPYILTPLGMYYRGEINCEQIAYNLWDADITYTRRPKDIGSFTWDLDGSGTTEHITHSLETIASYPAGTAPSFNNAIGVEQENIAGVDVIRPAARFTVQFTHPAGVLTLAYANYLAGLVGYVNSDAFFSWAAGEVRFAGVRANDGTQTQGSATYTFDISPNVTGLTVGTITGIDKKGWEVAWVKNKQSTASGGGTTYHVMIPQFVYVERVSYTTAFQTAFGFG